MFFAVAEFSFSKWCLIVAPNREGLEMIAKGCILNLQTSKLYLETGFWISFSHRNLVTPQSVSLSSTCKEAFSVSENSWKPLRLLFIFVDASYTILIFVVVFSGAITAWWGMQRFLFSWSSSDDSTLSIIPFAICSWMMLYFCSKSGSFSRCLINHANLPSDNSKFSGR